MYQSHGSVMGKVGLVLQYHPTGCFFLRAPGRVFIIGGDYAILVLRDYDYSILYCP